MPLSCSAGPVMAQVGTLLPVDEAAADPSFILFRARLLEAAAARDTAFVIAQLDPEVNISFGGAAGIDDSETAGSRDVVCC